jgi:hypothetical protein
MIGCHPYVRIVVQLWRYGKNDVCDEEYGRDYVTVGCSTTSKDEAVDESTGMATMQKWLVDVQCDGCRGLFYRSAPNVIVPDADWPRNGDVVMGYEVDTPGTSYGIASFLFRHHQAVTYSSYFACVEHYDRMDSVAKRLLSPDDQ